MTVIWVSVVSRAQGVVVSPDPELDGRIIWIPELIEKLQSGEIIRYDEGKYQWRDGTPALHGRIHCRRCLEAGLSDDNTLFISIGRDGGATAERLPAAERSYHNWFQHNELVPGGPCYDPPTGADIRPIRYQPYIPTQPGAGANQFNLVTDVIKPAGIDDDQWNDLVDRIEAGRGGLLSNDGDKAVFEWGPLDLDGIRFDFGDTYRLPPFRPGDYYFWKREEDRLKPVPLNSNLLEVPSSGDLLLCVDDCDCDPVPGRRCTDHKIFQFGNRVPRRMKLSVDPHLSENQIEFGRLVKEHHPLVVCTFSGVSFWIEYESEPVTCSLRVTPEDEYVMLLGARVASANNIQVEFSPIDSYVDKGAFEFANIDTNEQNGNFADSEYNLIEKIRGGIPLNPGRENFIPLAIRGFGLLTVKIAGREQFSQPIKTGTGGNRIRILVGAERDQVMQEIDLGFDREARGDAYGNPADDEYFRRRVWDLFRATQHESEDEDGLFSTNRTTRRLNKLRNLLPELNSLMTNKGVKQEGRPEPSNAMFLRLMEWIRPHRDEDEDGNFQWETHSPRAVGSEELEWYLLFDSRPVYALEDEGLENGEIRLLKNGLRLIKPEAALRLGIEISDRIPAMDYVSESPDELLLSLFMNLSADDIDRRRQLYSNLLRVMGDHRQHMFCGDAGGASSDTVGIWANEMMAVPRNSSWWSEGEGLRVQCGEEVDGVRSALTLHRFTILDPDTDEWGYQYYLIYRGLEGNLAIKVFSRQSRYAMPSGWIRYIKSAPKAERNIRMFDLLREVVRAFYSLSGAADPVDSIVDLPREQKNVLPMMPYAVRKFFVSGSDSEGLVHELEGVCPDLAEFVESRTISQLWLNGN